VFFKKNQKGELIMKKFLTIFFLTGMMFVVGCVNADQTDQADQVINSEVVDIYDIYYDTEFDKNYIIADGWAIELDELEQTTKMMYADQIKITYDQNDTILGYEFQ
jgi:hypothetical protein